jgi:hypothetical protein
VSALWRKTTTLAVHLMNARRSRYVRAIEAKLTTLYAGYLVGRVGLRLSDIACPGRTVGALRSSCIATLSAWRLCI